MQFIILLNLGSDILNSICQHVLAATSVQRLVCLSDVNATQMGMNCLLMQCMFGNRGKMH